jgi:hypothetical protein
MSNRFSDNLFQLIHSLEKSEKRHFKLYIKRSSAKEDLKVVQLFDVLDKMEDLDEALLAKKIPSITKPQLANLRNHLYKEILASLRLLKSTNNIDLQLTENLDYARLLYNKGLKHQALKILEKAKEIAKTHQKFNFLVPLLSLEKKIETLHITRSTTDKTEIITNEASYISGHVFRVTKLSNLALLLYRWYVIHGHARNEADEKDVKIYFKNQLPEDVHLADSFYEKLYLYQSYCWYAFIRQDFLMYYRYAKKWVDVFSEHPIMITVETGHYIKGMHTLLNAHFDLRNFDEFDKTLATFEAFEKTDIAKSHDNFRTHTFIYINSAKINGYIMKGAFKEGVALIPFIEEKLEEYSLYVDRHRILVFNYKFATLHFGNANFDKAIDYLLKIINGPMDLRIDLQCYARLLHLLAHYELGNFELMESLTKSVYRFMSKMKNLTVVEEEMFRFIKTSFGLKARQLKPELEKFLNNIKHLEKNRFETRAFAYLDVISWLESKVYDKPLSDIIQRKFLNSKRKNY